MCPHWWFSCAFYIDWKHSCCIIICLKWQKQPDRVWLCHGERPSPNKSQVMNTQWKRVFREAFVPGLVVFFSPSFLRGWSEFHLPLFYCSSSLKCIVFREKYIAKLSLHTSLQPLVFIKVNFIVLMNVEALKELLSSHNGIFCDIPRLNLWLAAKNNFVFWKEIKLVMVGYCSQVP